ncbi:dienelactone hydrolase family protein [Devosia sp. ZB163]|uniref:alpha/beta hydrolase n=1 Tax=Devosia sp. ZB163 TaxID=3025938 RepID=UPI0023621743|nr:dienelactone hydrolase family protein [Devosia sp. ZB163]MDC9826462.1 dienelactone hydrolase family protein [Devosia sp. ZB163]
MVKLNGPMLPPKSGGTAKQIVVLLHGYGADGTDLIGLGQHWGEVLPDALFVSPNAPTPCAGNPFGFEWFPLQVDRIAGRIEGAKAAAPVIVEFLEDLWRQTGVTAADTYLIGFSQGAMMALHVGTALPHALRGIVSFSGAFVPADDFPVDSKPPVALIHGDLDQVVDPRLSKQAADDLLAAGYDVTLHISNGTAHGIAPDGLDFATSFLVSQNN